MTQTPDELENIPAPSAEDTVTPVVADAAVALSIPEKSIPAANPISERPRIDKLSMALHEVYTEYAFESVAAYELYKQQVRVFKFSRKVRYANVRRPGNGLLLIFNNNPADVIWNVNGSDKRTVMDIMKTYNRTSAASGSLSPNLFHSKSFVNSRTTFISEHDDTSLRREPKRQAPPSQDRRPQGPQKAPTAESASASPGIRQDADGNVREAGGGAQPVRQDRKSPSPTPSAKPAAPQKSVPKPEKAVSAEAQKPLKQEKSPLAHVSDKQFSMFKQLAESKGWIKK